MQWTREPYLAYMTNQAVERPIVVELFGPLLGLEEEWRGQGATPEELSLDAFAWDAVRTWGCGGHCGVIGLPPRRTIEETADFKIERDGFGRTLKLDKRTATIPLPMDFPVKTMDDWLSIKPHYAWRDGRVDDRAVAEAAAQREAGAMIIASIPGGFDTARELMGEELACMAYYDQPELMHDILQTLRDTALRTLEEVGRRVAIDRLFVHEDFAGRSGPLVGPAQIDAFIKPYYRAVWDLVQDRGATLFSIDTDGNFTAVIPALRDGGINEMYPMEPAAGMDIVETRRQFGDDLKLRGGIDKFVVRNGTRDDIRREIEYKCQPAMRTGGVVFGLDHRIPNGTPIASYRFYVDTLREVLGLPPRDQVRGAWRRTA